MGTFGRLVFCEGKIQIVGKTKFFDSLFFIIAYCARPSVYGTIIQQRKTFAPLRRRNAEKD